MKNLLNKKILFIICGGISAYKSLETIRLFKKNGAEIKTILTASAKEFVTPLSVTSLSQGKVYSDLFSVENETEMDHISLSRWADIIVIAPATANTISKLAQGTTDDLASTVVLASDKDIILAPAMNVRMWEHPTTKTNIKKLKGFGYKLIGPEVGDMACGEYGEGKMSDPSVIAEEVDKYFLTQKNNKKFKALVTAGPTNLEITKDINLIKVETADEMLVATQENLPVDVAIFSAAVADFKINKKYENKIKKQENLNLNLEKNVDILHYVSNHNSMRPELVIGFAAETNEIDKNAEEKLNKKSCDWIISNDVSNKDIGFNSDYNEVTIHYKNKDVKKEKLSYKKKSGISDEIVDRIIDQLN